MEQDDNLNEYDDMNNDISSKQEKKAKMSTNLRPESTKTGRSFKAEKTEALKHTKHRKAAIKEKRTEAKTSSKLKDENKVKSNLNNYVMIAIVGLLLVFSIVQAFQISGLKEDIKSGTVSVGTAVTSGKTSTSNSLTTTRTATTKAPAMVGGC